MQITTTTNEGGVSRRENNIAVKIQLSEYKSFTEKCMKYEMLLNAIMQDVSLSYTEKGLRIKNDDMVMSLVRMMEPDRWDAAYDKLIADKMPASDE